MFGAVCTQKQYKRINFGEMNCDTEDIGNDSNNNNNKRETNLHIRKLALVVNKIKYYHNEEMCWIGFVGKLNLLIICGVRKI